jgi:hypothetical protein
MRKILSLDNRKRRPLPAPMEHGPSYLMDECEVMAPGRARSPTIIHPNAGAIVVPPKASQPGRER